MKTSPTIMPIFAFESSAAGARRPIQTICSSPNYLSMFLRKRPGTLRSSKDRSGRVLPATLGAGGAFTAARAGAAAGAGTAGRDGGAWGAQAAAARAGTEITCPHLGHL